MPPQLGARRHSAFSADADAGARGAVRVPQLRQRGGGPGVAGRPGRQGRNRAVGRRAHRPTRAGSPSRSPATVCARSGSTTRRSRRSPRSFARAWPPGPGSSGSPATITRTTGSASSRARHCTRLSILFARDVAERDRCERQHRDYLSTVTGVHGAVGAGPGSAPPFDGVPREHFGYRDRLSQPVIEGTGEQPTPGSGPPSKPASSSSATRTRAERRRRCRSRRCCRATAAISPTCGWRSTSARFASFCSSRASTPDEQELLAAKLMGRWRSGAPLVLCPDKDDPALGSDLQRDQRLSIQEMPTPTDTLPDRLAHPAHEPARHRREHAAPQDDPPGRHLWSAAS